MRIIGMPLAVMAGEHPTLLFDMCMRQAGLGPMDPDAMNGIDNSANDDRASDAMDRVLAQSLEETV